MGASDLPDPKPEAKASGESQAPILQVICITSGTLKICPNLQVTALPIYVTTSS